MKLGSVTVSAPLLRLYCVVFTVAPTTLESVCIDVSPFGRAHASKFLLQYVYLFIMIHMLRFIL